MKAIAALAIVLVTTSAARADWQYTKWGMTVDQVMAASKGQMKTCSTVCNKQNADDDKALLYGPYESGGFPFTAFAYFNKQTQTLASVRLRLEDPSKGNQLVGALRAKYGEPATASRSELIDMWVWRLGGDQIDVRRIGYREDQLYTLSYRKG